MFTGIISGVGRIGDAQPLGGDAYGRRLTIETPAGYLDDVALGDSIALNGACMTATRVDAMRTTARATPRSKLDPKRIGPSSASHGAGCVKGLPSRRATASPAASEPSRA